MHELLGRNKARDFEAAQAYDKKMEKRRTRHTTAARLPQRERKLQVMEEDLSGLKRTAWPEGERSGKQAVEDADRRPANDREIALLAQGVGTNVAEARKVATDVHAAIGLDPTHTMLMATQRLVLKQITIATVCTQCGGALCVWT